MFLGYTLSAKLSRGTTMAQYIKALAAESAHRPAIGITEVIFVALAIAYVISL